MSTVGGGPEGLDSRLKECLNEIEEFEKRFKTSSKDQNPKVFPSQIPLKHECDLATYEDPDTPPVTADVDEVFKKYYQLLDLLFDENSTVVSSYCTYGDTDTGDADPFATSIMTLFRAYGHHMKLLQRMIENEVSVTEEYTTVFRRNSMCTKMMTTFAKETGQQYLCETLYKSCKEVMDSNLCIEVEESNYKHLNIPVDQLQQNVKNLISRCQQFLDDVMNSLNRCPGSFRYLCYMLQSTVKKKWPDSGDDPWLRAIAGFFFLRFICPAIITPESIIPNLDRVNNETRRKFVLVAKVIQNLANGTSFAGKVKEWEPVDDWIKENSKRMTSFFQDLATTPTSYLPFIVIPLITGIDVMKALATLQQMTRVKMVKIVKILEHDYLRKSHQQEGDSKEIIRDLQSFLYLLNKFDFNSLVSKFEPDWKIPELSAKLLADTINAENQLLKPSFSADQRCITLNFQSDPDDRLLRQLMKVKEKAKKKDDQSEGELSQGKHPSTPKNDESIEESPEDKATLIPIKLLNPLQQALKLLEELVLILRGQHHKLKELRQSEKFRRFSLKAARLQKLDIHALNNTERKAFWINTYHLLYLHNYTLLGHPSSEVLRPAFFKIYQYKVGNHCYSLEDIKELLRGNSGDYRRFVKEDLRRTFGLNTIDGRVFFALSNFCVSAPRFRVYYPDTIEEELDKQLEEYVSNHVNTQMESCQIFLPMQFEVYSEELKNYVHKKYGVKATTGMEWSKHLLTHDISGGTSPKLLENPYNSLQKLTKRKPEFAISPWDWTAKYGLDVVINAPPDPEENPEEDDDEKKKKRIKPVYDENSFPSVPWPEVRLELLSKEELIEYIRVCKRCLKQGAAMYAELIQRMDGKSPSF